VTFANTAALHSIQTANDLALFTQAVKRAIDTQKDKKDFTKALLMRC